MSHIEDIVRELETRRSFHSSAEERSRGPWGETAESRTHSEVRYAFDTAIGIVKKYAPPEPVNGWATGGADSYETDSLRCRIEDLEADLAARDRTIAEQAEALEGYREFAEASWDDELHDGESVGVQFGFAIQQSLPAHEIAALRQRGVEVEEVDGGNE